MLRILNRKEENIKNKLLGRFGRMALKHVKYHV